MADPSGRVPAVALDPVDAAELVEILDLLGDWLGSADSALLARSLTRYVGNSAYDTATLQADLARFSFLLGGDGERAFGPEI